MLCLLACLSKPIIGLTWELNRYRNCYVSLHFYHYLIRLFCNFQWDYLSTNSISLFCSLSTGAILFNSAIFCALIRPLPTTGTHPGHTSQQKETTHNCSLASKTGSQKSGKLLRDKLAFLSWCTYKVYFLDLVYCSGFWFTYGGHLVLLTFTPIRAHYLGFTRHQGAYLVSICGIASGTFRWVKRILL